MSLSPATGQSGVTQLQNITCADGVVPNPFHLHGVLLDDKENIDDHGDSNWLRRNDTYQMQQISGRMRVVVMPSIHNPQTSSSIIKDSTQGNIYIPQIVCAPQPV